MSNKPDDSAQNDTSFDDRPIKPHGCTCPLHPMQFLSYLYALISAYVFYFIDIIGFEPIPEFRIFAIIFFTLLFIGIIIITLIATIIDPTDPTVYKEKEILSQGYFLLFYQKIEKNYQKVGINFYVKFAILTF